MMLRGFKLEWLFTPKSAARIEDVLETTRRNLPWWDDLAPTEQEWANLYLRDVSEKILREACA